MNYEDKRNWPEYNDQLVRRGRFYLSADFVKNWDEELRKMNQHKNGHPYRYPETFIQFSGLAYSFLHLPYRQLEGFLRALSGFVPGLRSADYTTLWQRITNLELNITIPDNDIVVAVDSTGMKVTSRGDWMREKHGVERKGWIKVHIAVDVETRRPITFDITLVILLESILRSLREFLNLSPLLLLNTELPLIDAPAAGKTLWQRMRVAQIKANSETK